MKNKYIVKIICITLAFLCVISPMINAWDPIQGGGKKENTSEKQHVGVNGGVGSEEDPYILNLGTPIIKIYYKKDYSKRRDAGEKISNSAVNFEFTTGSNAANYMVEHNEDKGMLKFTLLGNTQQDLRVTSSKNINYFQAGGTCYLPILDSGDVQMPVYKIMAKETFNVSVSVLSERDITSVKSEDLTVSDTYDTTLIHETELGNGYLSIDDQIAAANISNYSQSYVFAQSNLDYSAIYKITDEQIRNKAKFNCTIKNKTDDKYTSEELNVTSANTMESKLKEEASYTKTSVYTTYEQNKYAFSGPVRVVYSYVTTNSRLNDSMIGEASFIERVISKLLTSLGDKFVKISKLGGTNGELYITIDSLVFNEYKNTVVDFWGDTTGLNKTIKDVINFWYKVFKAWAIVMYILIIIYIGIKVVLSSGTPEEKNVRPMLEGAIVGVLMLALLPFLFKYLVIINDSIVDILRANSKYSVYAYYTFEDSYRNKEEDGEDSMTSVLEDLKKEQKVIKENLENIEQEKEELENLYGEFIEMAQDAEQERENAQQRVNSALETLENLYIENYEFEFRKNGVTLSSDQLKSEMWKLVDEYVKNNNVKYDGENFVPDYHDAMQEIRKNFIEQLKVYDPKTGEEAKHPEGLTDEGKEWYTARLQNSAKRALIEMEYYYDPILQAEYAEKQKDELEKQLDYLNQKLQDVEDAIIKATNNDADIMGTLRKRAGKEYRIIYVILWFVMLFETILLLIIYYKRLFMIAILITIFPLVTIAYVYEKAKGEKPKILNNWMLEFSGNVFIQTIHAILYVTLVEVGYSIYIDNNDNVVFCLIAIVSLITAEPILKAILGIKASTVNDLVKYSASASKAAIAATAIAGTVTSTAKDLKSIDNKSKNEETKIAKNQKKNDDRLNTLRNANANRINGNSKLTQEEKEKKLKHWENVHNTTDKIKESARNKLKAARRVKKRMDMISRVTANATSAIGAVAGGIAAGGEVEDFTTAAGVAKAITGTGNNVKLSEDAQKNEAKLKNQVVSVSSDNPSDGESGTQPYQVPNYQGNSYGRYSYDNAANNAAEEAAQDVKPKVKPIFAAKYAKRLDEQKEYITKQYNITHENEK